MKMVCYEIQINGGIPIIKVESMTPGYRNRM